MEEIDFEVCPYGNSVQQHDGRRDILIEPAAYSDRSSGAFGTGGVRNWGRNRAVKIKRLVAVLVIF